MFYFLTQPKTKQPNKELEDLKDIFSHNNSGSNIPCWMTWIVPVDHRIFFVAYRPQPIGDKLGVETETKFVRNVLIN